ncbi:MAG TPA: CBS domain-containing protein [Candidatus Limnocylindria bacterium]|nr:CBS domain-containing protein [Candidatus Limnocylindria bacterium]
MSELAQSTNDTRRTKRPGDTTNTISRSELRRELVRVLARPEPRTVGLGAPLSQALEVMREGRGEAVMICDGHSLRGILTERDVLRRVLGLGVDPTRPVDEFMTPEPDTLRPDATLLEAMQMMQAGGYRNLPLVDEQGDLVGLLRQQDLLEYVAEAFPQEILNLPPRPHQLMEEQEGA